MLAAKLWMHFVEEGWYSDPAFATGCCDRGNCDGIEWLLSLDPPVYPTDRKSIKRLACPGLGKRIMEANKWEPSQKDVNWAVSPGNVKCFVEDFKLCPREYEA